MTRARSPRRQFLLTGIAMATPRCGATVSGHAIAQGSYPNKPIRLARAVRGGQVPPICRPVWWPNSPAASWARPSSWSNKGGAGGSSAWSRWRASAPDGYTIGMATVSTHGSNRRCTEARL